MQLRYLALRLDEEKKVFRSEKEARISVRMVKSTISALYVIFLSSSNAS